MKKVLCLICVLAMAMGCASGAKKMGDAMPTVVKVADTVQSLAHQLDSVYAFLLAQKLVPDKRAEATAALAALDAIAPRVKAGAEELSGDNFNWAAFVVQAAILAAQVMGYVAPLL